MVGWCMDMVLIDAQLWWDTPLQASDKGYNLRAKLNEEGNKSQKTFPIFLPAGNTVSPQSQVFKAAFLALLQGQNPPCAVAGRPEGHPGFPTPPSITSQQRLKARFEQSQVSQSQVFLEPRMQISPGQHWHSPTPQKFQLFF